MVLPGIAPGIVSGALLAFTLSIDDFVITFFTAGAGSATLPLKIYSMIKFGVTPEINAVSTVMILLTIGAVAAAGLLQRSEKWLRRGLRLAYTLLAHLFRRPALTALAAALVLTSCSGEKPGAGRGHPSSREGRRGLRKKRSSTSATVRLYFRRGAAEFETVWHPVNSIFSAITKNCGEDEARGQATT